MCGSICNVAMCSIFGYKVVCIYLDSPTLLPLCVATAMKLCKVGGLKLHVCCAYTLLPPLLSY